MLARVQRYFGQRRKLLGGGYTRAESLMEEVGDLCVLNNQHFIVHGVEFLIHQMGNGFNLRAQVTVRILWIYQEQLLQTILVPFIV